MPSDHNIKHTLSSDSLAETQPNYMSGFGNTFETEALPGALPQGINSPQKCNYGLYGEQLSGTAFTAGLTANTKFCFGDTPSWTNIRRPWGQLKGPNDHLPRFTPSARFTFELPHWAPSLPC